jgi:hypothetical protein
MKATPIVQNLIFVEVILMLEERQKKNSNRLCLE